MGGIVVAGADLELDPGGWQLDSTLHTPFEAYGKINKGSCIGAHNCRVGWVIEVCACCAVAVPEVVVEAVGLLLG